MASTRSRKLAALCGRLAVDQVLQADQGDRAAPDRWGARQLLPYQSCHSYPRVEPSAGSFGSERVDTGDTLSGATEQTTYMLNDGGVLFTFQKPFVITQTDVDAKTENKIDLVVSPESFGQA